MLSIVVCVKAVPDPKKTDRLKIDPATKLLPRLELPLVINPLDRNALEAALQLKQEYTAQITVVSMGPPPAGEIVKECLALGADQGILLSDPAFAGADTYATAFTLAAAIQKLGPVDLVLCGRASSDGATEWVGPELATFLNLPVVTMVRELVQTAGPCWQVKAEIENGYRLVQVEMPAVFTVTQYLNTPHTLSFSGIIKARKKEIVTWGLDDLALTAESAGQRGSPTTVSKLAYLEKKRACQMIGGTLEEKVDALVNILVETGVVR
jgi:electron transfer flavoprotein beta subunit